MYLSTTIKDLLGSEGMELKQSFIHSSAKIDSSMHTEDETGKVTELCADAGSIETVDGRKGKVMIVIDFRETSEMLTEKEYGS